MSTPAPVESRPPGIVPETGARRSMRIDTPLVIFLGAVVVLLTSLHRAHQADFDFGVFYYAARMFWEGARTVLYDLNAQHAFQASYGREPNWLFVYPPFALLPFLPLASLPPTAAFIAWTVVSLCLLVLSLKSLSERVGLHYGNWPVLLSLMFVPVYGNLLHGQVSVVALAALIWCYTWWKDGRRFAGGMVLALLTFKFQLVAGLLCVLVLRAKWRELAGFICGGIPLLLLSAAMVGPRALLSYPSFALQSEADPGVNALKMVSLHGLVTLTWGPQHQAIVVACLSAVILCLAAWLWKDLDTGFACALLASLLVAYHCNVHDVTIALIPFFLLVTKYAPQHTPILAGIGLALPILIAAGPGYFSILAIPLIGALAWLVWWRIREPEAAHVFANVENS